MDSTSLVLRAVGIGLLIVATSFGFNAADDYRLAQTYRDYKSLTIASSKPIPPERAASYPAARLKQGLYNHHSGATFGSLVWLVLLTSVGTYLLCGGRFKSTPVFDRAIRVLGVLLGLPMIAGGLMIGGVWSAAAFENDSVILLGSIIWLLVLGAALTLPLRLVLCTRTSIGIYYSIAVFSLCYLIVSGVRKAVLAEATDDVFSSVGFVGVYLTSFLIVGFHILSTKSAANKAVVASAGDAAGSLRSDTP